MNKTTLMLNVGIAIMALVMISLGFLVGDVDAAPLGDKLGCRLVCLPNGTSSYCSL